MWLATWAKQSPEAQERKSNIYIYVALVCASIIVSILRSVFSFHVSLALSVSCLCPVHIRAKCHLSLNGINSSQGRLPPSCTIPCCAACSEPRFFFSTGEGSLLLMNRISINELGMSRSNPFGRVLNRFSKDQHFIDDMLPFIFYDFVQCTLMVLAAIVVVCVGSPIIAVILLPLVWYFLSLRWYFLRTSREVKRLDALCRSPLFSLISESLDGLTTIRAFGVLQKFQAQHKVLLDAHTRADFSFMSSARWLGFRLDVSVVILLAASTFGAAVANQFNIGGSSEALAAGLM